MPVETLPIAGACGAEIRGVNVAQMDDQTFAEVRHALLDHGVIYFRSQELTPDQQVAFARRWGDIHAHPYLRTLPDHPEIIEIVKEPEDKAGFGDSWHTDQIFTPTPAMATMLYAKVVPLAGGDTMFSSLRRAYEALSPGMQRLLHGLRTYNLYDKAKPRSGKMAAKVADKERPAEPAIHPLIRKHPETGEPVLYINDLNTTRHFDGLSEEESRPLLEFLLAHATRPEFTCRVRWEPGTLGMWDNRSMLHKALNDYYGHRRVMHRITIKGEKTYGIGELPRAAAAE